MFMPLCWGLLVLIFRVHLFSSAPIPADVGQSVVPAVEADSLIKKHDAGDARETSPSSEEPAEKVNVPDPVIDLVSDGIVGTSSHENAAITEWPNDETRDEDAPTVFPELDDLHDPPSEGPVGVIEVSENVDDVGFEESPDEIQAPEEPIADLLAVAEDSADIPEQSSSDIKPKVEHDDSSISPAGATDKETLTIIISAELEEAEEPSPESSEKPDSTEKSQLPQKTVGIDGKENSSSQEVHTNEFFVLPEELIVNEEDLVKSTAEETIPLYLDEDLIHIVPLISAEDNQEPQTVDPKIVSSEAPEKETEQLEEDISMLPTSNLSQEEEPSDDDETIQTTKEDKPIISQAENRRTVEEERIETNDMITIEELGNPNALIEGLTEEKPAFVPMEDLTDGEPAPGEPGAVIEELTHEEPSVVIEGLTDEEPACPGEPGAVVIKELTDSEPAPEEPGAVVIEELTPEEPVIVIEEPTDEETAPGEPGAVVIEELTDEEPPVVEELTDEELAPEEPGAVVIEELTDEEPVVVIEELTDEEPLVVIEEPIDEEPLVVIEELTDEEPVVVIEELTDEEPLVVIEEPIDEEPAPGEPGVVIEELTDEEPLVVIEELTDEEPLVVIEELTDEEPLVVIEELTDEEPLVVIVEPIDEEPAPGEPGVVIEELTDEEPLVFIEELTNEESTPEEPGTVIIEELTDEEAVVIEEPIDEDPAPGEPGAVVIEELSNEEPVVIEELTDGELAAEETGVVVIEELTHEEPLVVIEELTDEEPTPGEPGAVVIEELSNEEPVVVIEELTDEEPAPEEPDPVDELRNEDSANEEITVLVLDNQNAKNTPNEMAFDVFEEAPIEPSPFDPVEESEHDVPNANNAQDESFEEIERSKGTIAGEKSVHTFAPRITFEERAPVAVMQKAAAAAAVPKIDNPVVPVRRGAVLGVAFFALVCFIITGFVGTAVSKKLR